MSLRDSFRRYRPRSFRRYRPRSCPQCHQCCHPRRPRSFRHCRPCYQCPCFRPSLQYLQHLRKRPRLPPIPIGRLDRRRCYTRLVETRRLPALSPASRFVTFARSFRCDRASRGSAAEANPAEPRDKAYTACLRFSTWFRDGGELHHHSDGHPHPVVSWRVVARPSQASRRSCRSVLAVGFLPGRTLAFERYTVREAVAAKDAPRVVLNAADADSSRALRPMLGGDFRRARGLDAV